MNMIISITKKWGYKNQVSWFAPEANKQNRLEQILSYLINAEGHPFLIYDSNLLPLKSIINPLGVHCLLYLHW